MTLLRFSINNVSIWLCLIIAMLASVMCNQSILAQDFLGQEQAQEKIELGKINHEIKDIKSTINSAVESLNQVGNQLSDNRIKEIHLFAKEANWELQPGLKTNCLAYNNKVPGPTIRAQVGDLIRIVLHNQMKIPTSMCFHGLILPHNVNGVPRQREGIIEPGKTYIYQFETKQPGTFFYHPQIIHSRQKLLGLYGVIVVEPNNKIAVSREHIVILGELNVNKVTSLLLSLPPAPKNLKELKFNVAKTSDTISARKNELDPTINTTTYYTVNGKTAPAIPSIELHQGERVLLHIINISDHAVPLHLNGHIFEIISINGSDALEPHIFRDTVTVNPSDRIDLAFSANNPGVWPLASEITEQSTYNGKFPGGIALIVRYIEAGATSGPR